jgi:hypothetical protein
MGYEVLNDMLINKLLTMPKKVTNPCTREKTKGKHVETNYTVILLQFSRQSEESYRRKKQYNSGDRTHEKLRQRF